MVNAAIGGGAMAGSVAHMPALVHAYTTFLFVACVVGLVIMMLGVAVALAYRFLGRRDGNDVFLKWLAAAVAVLLLGMLPVYVAIVLPIVAAAGVVAVFMRWKAAR